MFHTKAKRYNFAIQKKQKETNTKYYILFKHKINKTQYK